MGPVFLKIKIFFFKLKCNLTVVFFVSVAMKKKIKNCWFAVLVFFPAIIVGQKIDNASSFRDIKSANYFRFHYDNDYFTATDYYYTQGYNFEFTSPILQKNPINNLFLKPSGSEFKYGV